MYKGTEVSNIVNLYKADLHQIQSLTNSQEIWLGIIIDAAKLIKDSIDLRTLTYKDDVEYTYIGIFNKIRMLFDQLQPLEGYFQDSHFSLCEGVRIFISEIIELRKTTIPVKQSIIGDILAILPDTDKDKFFDLVNFFCLLPFSLLSYYDKVLSETNNFPLISNLLDVYNSLESFNEIEAIIDRAVSAREILIKNNLPYVKWFAYKYRNSGLDYEDVIQEGNIGLIKAVDRFDVRRNTKLKTLAVWWIRQSITRAIADNSRIIRLPVHLSDSFQSLKQKYKQYTKSTTKEPPVTVLAEASGLEVKRVFELIEWAKPPLSLERMTYCEENLTRYTELRNQYKVLGCQDCEHAAQTQREQVKTLIVDVEIPICLDQSLITPSYEKSDFANLLYKIFPDNYIEDQIDRLFNEKINQITNNALNQLNPRERRILEYRYGFKTGEYNTLQVVAEKFDVTRERIRQIESAALVKLKQILLRHPTIRDYQKLE